MGQSDSRRGPDPIDPCEPHLKAYTDCVERHTKGLSEGDECAEEVVAYKKCRKDQKDDKLKLGESVSKG
jgi:hypothetical protein